MLEFLSKEKYQILDSVSSTNDYIKDKDLFLVIANSQSGGKGTNNRSFFSPSGGIYLSVKLDIKTENLPFVTAYTAVAVINALEKSVKLKADIKWVNDIYVGDKKLGGILSESIVKNGGVSTVIIGVGLNVKKQNFPSFNLNTPTSIEQELCHAVDKEEIISELVKEFLALDSKIESKEFISVYKNRSILIGKTVQISKGSDFYNGKVVSINDDLSINIEINGVIKTFYNGDIKIIL
ncbi:MAG: biotin--[acetyl-CoA-carboxylase] ligase [Clostridiales bacterium]|nr:biotin--[acetyl-CoA-carboxylase] ligase [Clostridiales bacterium]